jgi:hypothetical protein
MSSVPLLKLRQRSSDRVVAATATAELIIVLFVSKTFHIVRKIFR